MTDPDPAVIQEPLTHTLPELLVKRENQPEETPERDARAKKEEAHLGQVGMVAPDGFDLFSRPPQPKEKAAFPLRVDATEAFDAVAGFFFSF